MSDEIKGINFFKDITVGELLEIKKIDKMTLKEGFPKTRELRDKYNFTDTQTRNLLRIAFSFNPPKIYEEKPE